MIKVQKSADSGAVVVQTAEFDATGRRMKKTVTNSGIHNGVVVYLYDGHKVLETRNGSNQVVQQTPDRRPSAENGFSRGDKRAWRSPKPRSFNDFHD